jgi:predicted 2-oxoglutarate/Fe(II)-dependent dioxygenase YbiX
VCGCADKHDSKIKPYIIEALKSYQDKCSDPSQEGGNTGNNWISKICSLRLNRYKEGTTMREHYDHIHSIFDGKAKGVPILSIVINLNEEYEGAEFFCRDKEIKLKAGDILIFPSNFMFPHEVKECKKGIRYSIVAWAY